jgi:ribosomal protein S18 acetylase RimI-like enzyme
MERNMAIKISEMKNRDYDEVYALWQRVEGMGLFSHSDSKQAVSNYLRRNRGFSFVARDGRNIIGVVLGGHDGRRGYLYHLAVEPVYRQKGIGKKLVKKVIKKLESINIHRCHLFVSNENTGGQKFWGKLGWSEVQGFKFMSRAINKKDKMINVNTQLS